MSNQRRRWAVTLTGSEGCTENTEYLVMCGIAAGGQCTPTTLILQEVPYSTVLYQTPQHYLRPGMVLRAP